MKKTSTKSFRIYLIFLLSMFFICCSNTENEDFFERTKIALRDVGNELLIEHKDSTSLVLPIKEITNNTYSLSFEENLSFEPSALVSHIKNSFEAAGLPQQYRVEVLNCSNNEVSYSYQMNAEDQKTITPCSGRVLPSACYLVEVKFTKVEAKLSSTNIILFFTGFATILVLGFLVFKNKSKKKITTEKGPNEKLGIFRFYPEQNKLVKEAEEIALSKKECELLALFVANPKQIIKRDELTKRVWEDNGVYVSRSIDTYISKLRKKLKADTSIKLTNLHGVGYKLEIS